MGKHQTLTLTDAQRQYLQALVRAGNTPVALHQRARILLACDASTQAAPPDAVVAEQIGCHLNTVGNVRRRAVTEGVEAALPRKPLPPRSDRRKVTGEVEAHLIALCCSTPPEGHARWTLRLLADKAVELGYVERLSHTTVGEALKQTNCGPGACRPGALASPRPLT